MSQFLQRLEQIKQYYRQSEPALMRFKVPYIIMLVLLYFIVMQLYVPVHSLLQARKLAQRASLPLPTVYIEGLALRSMGGSAFGDYSAQQQLPLTTLPIQLQGVGVQGSDATGSADSWALISTPDGKIRSYKVGDVVQGAEITSIEGQQVVLRNNGQLERLILQVPEVQAVPDRR